jgi:hypothetical protein
MTGARARVRENGATDMTCAVVTEGRIAKALLDRLLAEEVARGEVSVSAASGVSAASSLARTIVANRYEPTVLVIDADSSDPGTVGERRSYYTYSLESISPGVPCRVVLAVPVLEAIFFQAEGLVEEALEIPPLADAQRMEARYAPVTVLRTLSREAHPTSAVPGLLSRLRAAHIEALRATDIGRDILAAVAEVSREAARA